MTGRIIYVQNTAGTDLPNAGVTQIGKVQEQTPRVDFSSYDETDTGQWWFAGNYNFQPDESVSFDIAQGTHAEYATNLVAI